MFSLTSVFCDSHCCMIILIIKEQLQDVIKCLDRAGWKKKQSFDLLTLVCYKYQTGKE